MSESTAVAEEVTPEPIAQAEPENPTVTPDPVTQEDASPTESQSEPVEFDVESLPEWQATVKADSAEAPKTEPELPGEPVEQVEARWEEQRARRHVARMQANDASWRQFFQDELGLPAQDAQLAWQKFGPVLREVFQDNDAFTKAVFNHSVKRALPPESAAAYERNAYNSQAEAVAAIHKLGEAQANAAWEAKVAKGEFVPKASAKTIVNAAVTAYRAELEKQGLIQGTASSASVRGSASNGQYGSEAALNRDYNSRANSANPMSREQYAREYKRLTGRDP